MSTDLPIRFDDVTIATGNATLLDGVSLTVAAGAPTVLIGPNGAGKTTLLRAAMGLVAPARGSITWQGREHVPPVLAARPAAIADYKVGGEQLFFPNAGDPNA